MDKTLMYVDVRASYNRPLYLQDSNLYCDNCERSMTSSKGNSVIGFSMQFNFSKDEDFREIYPELNSNIELNLCFPCWIKAMGFKTKLNKVKTKRR